MEEIEKIKKALGIAKAICVNCSDEDVESSKNYRACDGILAAADGKVVKLNAGSCSCEGGKGHLGLRDEYLLVSVPFERIEGIARAIDLSTAGTAEEWKKTHR